MMKRDAPDPGAAEKGGVTAGPLQSRGLAALVALTLLLIAGGRLWGLAAGAAVVGIAALRPDLLAGPAGRFWPVAARLGLGLVYFGFVTPAALLRRLVARDDGFPLRPDPAAVSYWRPRRDPGVDDFRRPF